MDSVDWPMRLFRQCISLILVITTVQVDYDTLNSAFVGNLSCTDSRH